MKRELNEQEKKFINKRLISLEFELEGIEKIDIAKKQLAIDTANIAVDRQLDVLKKEVKQLTNEAEIIRATIKILHEQLEIGVDIIEPEKEDKKKDE